MFTKKVKQETIINIVFLKKKFTIDLEFTVNVYCSYFINIGNFAEILNTE